VSRIIFGPMPQLNVSRNSLCRDIVRIEQYVVHVKAVLGLMCGWQRLCRQCGHLQHAAFRIYCSSLWHYQAVCVPSVHVLSWLTEFHKIWYQHYTTEIRPKDTLFSVTEAMTTFRMGDNTKLEEGDIELC